ncbi:MAG TPA: hypothetical protein VIZ32_10250 [Vicinamibacterales bacterium]
MQYEIRHRLVCDDAEWKEQEQQRRVLVLPEADGGEVAHETCEHRDGVRVRLQRAARGQR